MPIDFLGNPKYNVLVFKEIRKKNGLYLILFYLIFLWLLIL